MVDWAAWEAEAFNRSSREGKPILLSISAAWCRACHEMDRTTYADPIVAALIRERFVAVRVDADRRPDINDRYNLGGWPTTAFLTSAGEILTGGTFVPADRMPGVLSRVAAAYAERLLTTAPEASDQAADADAAAADRPEDDGPADLAPVIDRIFASFDGEFGGFGVEPKFPHAAPLHLALSLFRDTGDARWRVIVERTLDAMADEGLWDPAGGGFYRYATTRDWQLPHVEKLLETNAALLNVYAQAALVLGRPIDRDRTAAIAAFITGPLRAEGGGYHGSDADAVLYADGNALAASALLSAAAVLGESALAREALAGFERVVLACYRPGLGMAHYFDGAARLRGLLADQAATVTALLDAHDASDLEPYQMMAEEIGHFMVREMWDAREGGFFDRSGEQDDVGLLRRRRKPLVANAEAARALARLQRVSREFDFAPHASGALRAAARQLDGQGPLAAHYVIAAREVG